MSPHAPSRWAAVAVAAVATLSFGAVPASASTASEEQQGAALVKSVNSGDRTCSELSATDFERIGEYAMGLNFPTVAQHDAMNQRMRAMMGTQGEEQAHEAMGRAYAACAKGASRGGTPGAGMMGGGGYGAGMMGGSPSGPGMMGNTGGGVGTRGSAASAHHDWDTGGVLLVALLAAGVGAIVAGLFVMRLSRRRPAAGA